MSVAQFDLEAGALCLDFANTVEWHASDQPQETLGDIGDLIAWGEAASILTPAQAQQLSRLAQQRPQDAALAYARAIRLREAIYRIFSNHARAEAVAETDLATLNEDLQDALFHLRIAVADSGFTWDWVENQAGFSWIRWPVARSAAELLTSDLLNRVSQCADDRGCGYLFVDTSRNHSRRWCSMESCGNRAKAQRHYRRQQED